MKLKSIKNQDSQALYESFALSEQKEHVKTFRLSALKRFTDMGLPGKKIEEYKDSKIQELLDREFQLEIKENLERNSLKSFFLANTYTVVLVNGALDRTLSVLPDEDIAEILSLSEFYEKTEDTLKIDADLCSNSLYFLGTALAQNGLSIRMKKGKKLDKQLHILNVSSTSTAFLNTKTVVHVEEEAHLEIIDHYRGVHSLDNFINHTVDIHVEKNGNLELSQLQMEAENNILIDYSVHIHENALFTAHSFNTGANFGLSFWHIYLSQRKAKAVLNGLVHISLEQRVGNIINIYHNAEKTESEQLFKQILKNRSKGIFYGKVVVSAEGKGTSAKQLSKTLLLSKEANIKINSKPHLEIYIDDLTASHGATVGNLDEDQIFYLTSRGIAKDMAIKMLVDAFQNELIDKINNPQVSQIIYSQLHTK